MSFHAAFESAMDAIADLPVPFSVFTQPTGQWSAQWQDEHLGALVQRFGAPARFLQYGETAQIYWHPGQGTVVTIVDGSTDDAQRLVEGHLVAVEAGA